MNIVHKMFAATTMSVEPYLMEIKAAKILEISMSEQAGCRYGRLSADCQRRIWDDDKEYYVDRIDISELLLPNTKPYREVFSLEKLDHPEALEKYDLIILTDLLEELDPRTAKSLLTELCQNTAKQILVLASMDEPSEVVFDKNLLDVKVVTYLSMPENFRFFTVSAKEGL